MDPIRCEIGSHNYVLEFGPPEFTFSFGRSLTGKRVMVLGFSRETQFENVAWLRLITLHLGWPWFRNVAGVMSSDEQE